MDELPPDLPVHVESQWGYEGTFTIPKIQRECRGLETSCISFSERFHKHCTAKIFRNTPYTKMFDFIVFPQSHVDIFCPHYCFSIPLLIHNIIMWWIKSLLFWIKESIRSQFYFWSVLGKMTVKSSWYSYFGCFVSNLSLHTLLKIKDLFWHQWFHEDHLTSVLGVTSYM